MNSDHAVPQISLVIKWPQTHAAAPVAEQLVKRLVADRLAATWAIEQASQAKKLLASARSIAGVDAALLISASTAALAANEPDAADFTYEVRRALDDLGGAGLKVISLCVDGELPRGVHERRLRELGVRAIVVSAGMRRGATAVRALPFGMWQLTPRVHTPAARRWPRLIGRRSPGVYDAAIDAPTLANIDLGRLGSTGTRGWREVERLLASIAEASRRGAVAVTTVAQVAAQLAQANASRPQRSILRMAA